MSKLIKVRKTGVVTEVSNEYFEAYVGDGWFIEVPKPKVAPKPKAAPKPKEVKE